MNQACPMGTTPFLLFTIPQLVNYPAANDEKFTQ